MQLSLRARFLLIAASALTLVSPAYFFFAVPTVLLFLRLQKPSYHDSSSFASLFPEKVEKSQDVVSTDEEEKSRVNKSQRVDEPARNQNVSNKSNPGGPLKATSFNRQEQHSADLIKLANKKKPRKKSSKLSSPSLDGFLYHADGVVGYVYQDAVFIQQPPELQINKLCLPDDEQSIDDEWVPPSEGFIYHAVVPHGWPQQSVAEAGLRNLGGLFLVGVQRGVRFLAAVGPSFCILNGDLLGFAGTTDNFVEFCKSKGLYSLGDCLEEGLNSFIAHDFLFTITEQVIIRSKSWLIGKTAKEVGFRARYGASIVSVSRVGEAFPVKNWGQVEFKAGDALVLLKSAEFDWTNYETKRDMKVPSVFRRLE